MSASSQLSANKNDDKRKEQLLGTVFLTSVAGLSAVGGFSYALVAAKKQAPSKFAQGFESGAALGFRALGWGTLCAVSGVGILTFVVFKSLGVRNLGEFRSKMETTLQANTPRVREADPPGRRNFASIRQLFEFLSSDDKKLEDEQKKNSA